VKEPKQFARLWLEVTAVRCERLWEITEEDAQKEGCEPENADFTGQDRGAYVSAFCKLWDSINGKKYPWSSNPWVFVYAFKKINKDYEKTSC
jgi:hypothetical protein